MPYAMLKFFHARHGVHDTTAGDIPQFVSYRTGINMRPWASLVLKTELFLVTFPSAGNPSWGQHRYAGIQFQTAWLF